MWFRQFKASYGQSDFTMNGYLQNVIDYALSDKAVLKRDFNINSRLINVDEFMVFATPENTDNSLRPVTKVRPQQESAQPIPKVSAQTSVTRQSLTGVLLIPASVSVTFTAKQKK